MKWFGAAVMAAAALALALWAGSRPAPNEAKGRRRFEASGGPRLDAVGPRHLSNQTDHPLSVHGRGLKPGMKLVIDGPSHTELDLRVTDPELATVRLAGSRLDLPSNRSLGRFDTRLVAADGTPIPGRAPLWVVNDADHRQPVAMACDPTLRRFFVASPSTDELLVVEGDGPARIASTGDGPVDLETFSGPDGRRWLAVVHRWDGTVWILSPAEPERAPVVISVGGRPTALSAAADRPELFVTERTEHAVVRLDLSGGLDAPRITRHSAGVRPGPTAPDRDRVFVGNLGSTDLSVIRLDRKDSQRYAPSPETEIIGGHTAPFRRWIMGGSAPRDVAYSPSRDRVFVADLGPNIGPNPKRMEVSMNGGIEVFDPETRRFRRHVSLLQGVPERLALDDTGGILYVTDVATGRLVALDVDRLVDGPTAEAARLAVLEFAPPKDFPLIRRRSEFGIDGRSSTALHSGPSDLCLSADGTRALVLQRFTGVVSEVDLDQVRRGRWVARTRFRIPGLSQQRRRRTGEVVYHTDLGNSRMSCDACHFRGHSSGVLFTKSEPLHIYRTPTLRSVRESPPYFTPALLPSLRVTARFVLSRNRYHNPDAAPRETLALDLYQQTIAAPPNPFRGPMGGLPDRMKLPDGSEASPLRGRSIFRNEGGCVSCHPPPQFTTDQSEPGRLYDVGTPVTLPVRPEMQDADPYRLPAPSLVGVWDHYPLLHAGGGGFAVVGDDQVRAVHRWPIWRVLQMGAASGRHGSMHELKPEGRKDLWAYLRTL